MSQQTTPLEKKILSYLNRLKNWSVNTEWNVDKEGNTYYIFGRSLRYKQNPSGHTLERPDELNLPEELYLVLRSKAHSRYTHMYSFDKEVLEMLLTTLPLMQQRQRAQRGASGIKLPKHLTDVISQRIFVDPVITKHGVTYSRQVAAQEGIPVLGPDHDMRKAVRQFQQKYQRMQDGKYRLKQQQQKQIELPEYLRDVAGDFGILVDPVVASDGFTYSRRTAQAIMQNNMNGRAGKRITIVEPNLAMRQAVRHFKQKYQQVQDDKYRLK